MNVITDSPVPTSMSFFPQTYKIMIIGKSGVGKTSLLWRFLHNEFKDLRGTIIDVEQKKMKVKDGTSVVLALMDTARLETHYTLSPNYLRDANAVIIVYDITDPTSYVEVKDLWLRMVFTQFGQDADQHIPILIVGSKSDLIDKYDDFQVCVRPKDVKEDLKSKHSCLLGPIECSSKTGKNVDKVFQEIAENTLRRDMEGSLRVPGRRYGPYRPKIKQVGDYGCAC